MQGQQAISINNGQDTPFSRTERVGHESGPVGPEGHQGRSRGLRHRPGAGRRSRGRDGPPGNRHPAQRRTPLLVRPGLPGRPRPEAGEAGREHHQAFAQPVRIEGNTDDQPPDGILYTSNWDLSTDRALAVLKAMVNHGHGPEPALRSGQRPVQPHHAQRGRRLASQEPPRRHRDHLSPRTAARRPRRSRCPPSDEPHHGAGPATGPCTRLEYRP
jgi:hypothetical protein